MKKHLYILIFAVIVCLSVTANDKELIKCYIVRQATLYDIDSTQLDDGECKQPPPIFMNCFPADMNLKGEKMSHITVFNKTGEILFDSYTTDTIWTCVKDSLCPIKPGPYYYQVEIPKDTITQESVMTRGILNVIEQ